MNVNVRPLRGRKAGAMRSVIGIRPLRGRVRTSSVILSAAKDLLDIHQAVNADLISVSKTKSAAKDLLNFHQAVSADLKSVLSKANL